MDKTKVAAYNKRKKIYALIQQGKMTMTAIGEKCGVTRQRVSQIAIEGERVQASVGRPRKYLPCPFCPGSYPSKIFVTHVNACDNNPARKREKSA